MDTLQTPGGLRQRILLGIARAEYERARTYLLVSLAVVPASLVGVFFSARYLLQSLYQSGFYQYLSLLFSGDSVVLASWRELSYALIESMPVFETALFLSALTFFVWSGAHALTSARRLNVAPS